MKLFAALRKIREFERLQLPFVKSVIDFDIIIEIGYAEEEGQPLTLKQLFLMDISSRTTVRRRLARLIELLMRDKYVGEQQSKSKCRVLVADDNTDAASSLGILLEIMGHEVRVVHNGLEAVAMAEGFRPDVQEMGFDVYLIKPVELAALEKLLLEYPVNRDNDTPAEGSA